MMAATSQTPSGRVPCVGGVRGGDGAVPTVMATSLNPWTDTRF